MEELIRRLGEATEGSRDLDAEIVVALDIRPDWLAGQKGEMWIEVRRPADSPPDIRWKDSRVRRGAGNPTAWHSWPYIVTAPVYPHLTTNLQDALTLVPARWTWDADATAPECGIDWRLYEPKKDGRTIKGTSYAAPALALCIAALRAHQATKDTQP